MKQPNYQDIIDRAITQHKLDMLKEACNKFIASLKKATK